MTDPVNHPAHYTSSPATCPNCGAGIECITITEHWSFLLGNTLKYLWRCDSKGDALQDLRKARFYLDREIAKRERAGATESPIAPPGRDGVHSKPGTGVQS